MGFIHLFIYSLFLGSRHLTIAPHTFPRSLPEKLWPMVPWVARRCHKRLMLSIVTFVSFNRLISAFISLNVLTVCTICLSPTNKTSIQAFKFTKIVCKSYVNAKRHINAYIMIGYTALSYISYLAYMSHFTRNFSTCRVDSRSTSHRLIFSPRRSNFRLLDPASIIDP